MAEKTGKGSAKPGERTVLEPDQVAIVYDEENGYQIFMPRYEQDAEVPEQVAVLVAVAMRLTDDEEFYEEMVNWFEAKSGTMD